MIAKEVIEYAKQFEVVGVVVMHSHFDHIVELEKYPWKIYGHESTRVKVDEKLKDEIFGFKVLHTPGHIYDAICLYGYGKLFTSDTLFVEGCGRVDLEGAEPEKMQETLEKLKQLPDETVIYPGHDYGSTPSSTIGREKVNNGFL